MALLDRLPATIALVLSAFMAAIALGAFLAFVRSRTRVSVLREILRVPQLVGRATPVVLLALFLPILFVFTTSPLVPVLCLSVPFGAWSSLIFFDFFRPADNAARISARRVAGAVAMTVALIGPALLSATLIIEPQFAWPGVARLWYNRLEGGEFGPVAGFLIMYTAAVVLLKLCARLSPDIQRPTTPRETDSSPRRKGFSAIGIIALMVLLGAAVGAAAANLIAPAGPYVIDLTHWSGYPLAPGVAGHVLGTDENGRDVLARLLFALRTSLGVALLAAVVATTIGAFVAKALKTVPWFGDRGALSVTGIRPFGAFPFIIAPVAVVAAKSHTVAFLSPLVIALIIAAVSWPAIVPAFRAHTPATLGAVVDLTAAALLLEVTLSISGFGVQPPTPSLGNMLVNAHSNVGIAPWAAVAPSVFVVVTLFALYGVADELSEPQR
jgi:peptide/nickel transport system permease protein